MLSEILRRSSLLDDNAISPAEAREPAVFDTRNLYASSLAGPIAIYLGAYASLRFWRALRTFDTVTEGVKAADPKKPSKVAKVVVGLCLATFLIFEGAFIYSIWTGSVTGVIIGFRVLTTLLAWRGFAAPIFALSYSKVVTRLNRQSRKARRQKGATDQTTYRKSKSIPVAIPAIKSRRASAFLALAVSLGLATYTTITHDRNMFILMVGGLMYSSISTPSGWVHRSGWLSIRGMVMALGALVIFMFTLIAAMTFAILSLNDHTSDRKKAPSSSSYLDGAEKDIHAVNEITVHYLTMIVGSLIALVLRYEYTLSGESAVQLTGDENIVYESEKSEAVVNESLEEKAAAYASPAYTRFVRLAPRQSYFSAPLFHTALATFVLVHVPALVLVPRLAQLEAGAERSVSHLIMSIIAVIPPQLLAVIAVPSAVAIAAALRTDGNEMWKYAEHWVIMKEVKTEENATAVAVADVEAQPAPASNPVSVSA